MKNSLLKLVCMFAIIVMAFSCQQYPPSGYYPPQQQVYQPQAQMGYMGNQYGAYVTDDRGEQFFMDYVMFNMLMHQGGYNSVISSYYSQPTNTHIHLYNAAAFRRSGSPDAMAMNSQFGQTYSTYRQNGKLYRPSTKTVTHDIQLRQQRFGTAYQPSSARPAISHSVTLNNSSGNSISSGNKSSLNTPITRGTGSLNLSKSASSVSSPASTRSISISRSSSFSRPSSSGFSSRSSFSSSRSSFHSSGRH
jgi:hypothetical protein